MKSAGITSMFNGCHGTTTMLIMHGLERQAAAGRQVEEGEYDSVVDECYNNNAAWKYCLYVFRNDRVGQEETYDALGGDIVVHGEVYFNTYGVVDGY